MTTAFRVTHRTIHAAALGNLNENLSRMAALQEQLSSGRLINRPSDSPTGTVNAMQYRADIRRVEQFSRNGQDGLNWLATADGTLQKVLDLTGRLRELVLKAQSGATDTQGREAIAQEVETLRAGLLDLANTRYLDRPLFAGTADVSDSYDTTGAFLGDVGDESVAAPLGKVERQVAPGVTVRVNLTGPEVFGDPSAADDLFATTAQIAADLRAGDLAGLNTRLVNLDAHIFNVQNQLSKVGARYRQVEVMRQRADDNLLVLKDGLSGVEDIDLPKTIVDLQLQEVAYRSALDATARVIQPSLMDFLR